jgi:hypothetical protein
MGRTGVYYHKIGYSGGLFEHGNEPLDSIKKAGYFLTS